MSDPLPALTQQHLDEMCGFFGATPRPPTAAARAYRRALARYFNSVIPADASVLEVGCGTGGLLRHLAGRRKTGIDPAPAPLAAARVAVPEADLHLQAGETLDLPGPFDVIVVSDTLNLAADAERFLARLHRVATPGTRLLLNFHNNLWRPAFALARLVGLRGPQPLSSWLSRHDVTSLLELAGWEIVSIQPRLLWPWDTPLLSPLFNRLAAPLLPSFCLTQFIVARQRPCAAPPQPLPRVSVVIPARNEAGTIEAAVLRTPEMGAGTELVFVEGHSTDESWAEIQRVQAAHPGRRIRALRQTGSGKGNAVREGFAAATGGVYMILDADLTMPPEELPKFYSALASGRAEFANGSRLVYPMDRGAMRFLNMVANFAFAHAFSWLLGQRIKDTLCGTKALRSDAYARIAAGRAHFGDFDPFGDFDLLFGAGRLGMKIVDIPIRYRERTYGQTNIHRWRHGWLLLRMVAFAARKLKFV